MDTPVKLLWTGGWDSSFRLLQLLFVEKKSVQPIYVIDYSREGRWKELESMDVIAEAVRERKPANVELHPRWVYVRHDFPDLPELKHRYESLMEKTRVGSQYYWLAIAAEMEGLEGAELCMPSHEMPTSLQDAIFDDVGSEGQVLKDTWEADLFRYWSFPLLTLTKQEMRDIAKEYEFMDILSKRWFCFKPLNGKACGECRPCQIALEDGVTDGVSFVSPSYRLWRAFKTKSRRGLKRAYRVAFN